MSLDPGLVATCTEVASLAPREAGAGGGQGEEAGGAWEVSSAWLKQNVRATNLPKAGCGDKAT